MYMYTIIVIIELVYLRSFVLTLFVMHKDDFFCWKSLETVCEHANWILLDVIQVLLGASYRIYTSLMAASGISTKNCWQVNRGQGLSAVQSCEGSSILYGLARVERFPRMTLNVIHGYCQKKVAVVDDL